MRSPMSADGVLPDRRASPRSRSPTPSCSGTPGADPRPQSCCRSRRTRPTAVKLDSEAEPGPGSGSTSSAVAADAAAPGPPPRAPDRWRRRARQIATVVDMTTAALTETGSTDSSRNGKMLSAKVFALLVPLVYLGFIGYLMLGKFTDIVPPLKGGHRRGHRRRTSRAAPVRRIGHQ